MSQKPAPPEPRSFRRMIERAAVAHFVAYPIAFGAAAAAMPLTISLFIADIEPLGGDTAAVGNFVVRRVAWPAGAAFALAHASVLPWVFGRDADRGRRRFLFLLGGLAVVIALFGGASWLWLVLRS